MGQKHILTFILGMVNILVSFVWLALNILYLYFVKCEWRIIIYD
jgi:hypothetical protein